MKSSITSNWRPFSRAFYVFPIVIAVLWGIPRNANAQLYVTNQPEGSSVVVSEYNADTGEVIKADLVAGLGGEPLGLGLSKATFYGLDKFLFVTNSDHSVGKYALNDGRAISRSFITGLNYPTAVAVEGALLVVVNFGNDDRDGSVGEYNAINGTAVKANVITGLTFPRSVAVPTPFTLFVTSYNSSGGFYAVGKYDTAGKAIKADFITGLSAFGLAVSDNTLFVTNYVKEGTVGTYNATTGEAIKANFITGLEYPIGLAVSGNTLFVAKVGNGEVGKGTVGTYNATTGEAIKANFITGLSDVTGIAIKNPK